MTDSELKSLFQIVDDNLNGAYETNDINKISRFLSDDWTMLEPQIGIISKPQFLKAIEDGRLSHSKMKKEVLQVRLYNDIAIVVTRGKNVGCYLDDAFDAEQWVTSIYKKIDSGWVCIFTQEAPVACE